MKHSKLLLIIAGLLVAVVGYMAVWIGVSQGIFTKMMLPHKAQTQVASWVVLPTQMRSRLIAIDVPNARVYGIHESQLMQFDLRTSQRSVVTSLPEGVDPVAIAADTTWWALATAHSVTLHGEGNTQQQLYAVKGQIEAIDVVDASMLAVVVHYRSSTEIHLLSTPTLQRQHLITFSRKVTVTQLFLKDNVLSLVTQSESPEVAPQWFSAQIKLGRSTITAQLTPCASTCVWRQRQLWLVQASDRGSTVQLTSDRLTSFTQSASVVQFGQDDFALYQPEQQQLLQLSEPMNLVPRGSLEPDTQYCGMISSLPTLHKQAMPCWQSSGEVYIYAW